MAMANQPRGRRGYWGGREYGSVQPGSRAGDLGAASLRGYRYRARFYACQLARFALAVDRGESAASFLSYREHQSVHALPRATGYTHRPPGLAGQSSSGQCDPALKLNQKPKLLNNFLCRSKCAASQLLGGYAFRVEIGVFRRGLGLHRSGKGDNFILAIYLPILHELKRMDQSDSIEH